ncbi:MAG: circularly permuted type 2 ATP-grasp protein [Bordetella sp.]|uniref:circularly permuted type 2 ATP-grasp protein n=1 Tax=Bordetella sp. TaxID=28081 RepID=UPI003F7B4808
MPQLLFQTDPARDASSLALHAALPVRAGHYDELRLPADAAGGATLRPVWARFFELLGPEGLRDMNRNAEAVSRQIQENGITYNIYADADGPTRPWSLDLLPFIIDQNDWRLIERGLAQRASLLNQIMADIYGPQTLLAEGLLPPALVQGHPGYLHPLRGYVPPGGVYLHIVAFDLARNSDGNWRVVSQRTQAPSGLGYLLENRITISGMFPAAFSELRVQRLAASYRRLIDMLHQLSPAGADGAPPRIALLTPGPYNETYFEQTYLARYLGLTLVEGGDLLVRDDQLFLKTLHGLERVHALLRRLDDDFCDPLELRSDSTLGIPGLLQAMRAGNVLVANALGTGPLESPALHGFLPAISRRLAGEPLVLPSLHSWWCGEAAACEQALPLLDRAVIKSTYPGSRQRKGFESQIGAGASREQLQALRARIEQSPDAHTVQAYLPLSQAPTWHKSRIVPRAAMVRMFALADGQGGWHVLPGGLTRIANRQQQIVSMQRGGSSMDTWVTTDGPVDLFSMQPASMRPEDIAQIRRPVSSRAAENLFWMGRYTERIENDARLANVTLNWLNGDLNPDGLSGALAKLCMRSGLMPAEPPRSARVFEHTLVAELASRDPQRGFGRNLSSLTYAAGQIRDRLSPEHWQLIVSAGDRYHRLIAGDRTDAAAPLDTEPDAPPRTAGDVQRGLRRLNRQILSITGAQTDHMTRDDGWRLLTIGRHTERLAAMAGMLAVLFQDNAILRDGGFNLLLQLFDSSITYRAYYQGRYEIPALLNLLVLDSNNPRSPACSLKVLHARLPRLPGNGADLPGLLPTPDMDVTLSRLCERDEHGRYANVLALADRLEAAASALSDEIGRRYFSHSADVDQSLVAA